MTTFPDFYRGDDYALRLTFSRKGQPVDITGWKLRSTLKLSSELPDTPELTDEGYRQVMTALIEPEGDEAKQGRATLLFPHQQTAQLLPVPYVVDLQRCHQQVVTTVLTGSVTVLADVSRERQHA